MQLGIRRKLIGTLMLVGLLPLALSLIVILGGGAAMRLHHIRNNYESGAAQAANKLAGTLTGEVRQLDYIARLPEVVELARQQTLAAADRRTALNVTTQPAIPPATAGATPTTLPGFLPDPVAAGINTRWSALRDVEEPVRGILSNTLADRLRMLDAGATRSRQLLATDAFGNLIAASDKPADYFQADELWWQQAYAGGEGRVYISSIVSNEVTGEPVIEIAVPIMDNTGPRRRVLGIIKDKLNVNWLRMTLEQVEASLGAQAQMVDLANMRTLLATRNDPDALHQAEQAYLRTRENRRGGLISAMTGDLLIGAAPVPLKANLHAPFEEAITPGWLLIISKPSFEAMTPVYRLALTVAVVGIALILVLFILGVAISNREIIMPILRLREATAAVGRGELNVRLLSGPERDPTFRQDELGQLAHDFDDMTRELQKNVGALARNNEAKRRFMELAGHELRTPVTYILSACQLAQRQIQSAQQKAEEAGVAAADGSPSPLMRTSSSVGTSLGKIVTKAQRLARIIDNLLKLVNNDQFTTRLSKQPVDMRALILHVCNDARPFIQERKQNLLVDVAEKIDPIQGDRDKLEDVISNLLSNAIRFTPDGGTIRVAARPVIGDMLEILVEDSGPGISQADLANLFEPFYTGTDTLHHHSGTIEYGSKGIGLGLAIVRRFVEIHGGVVRAHNTGKGTQFEILLPLYPGRDGGTDVGDSTNTRQDPHTPAAAGS